jgi:osmotically-inducible protein OsmY
MEHDQQLHDRINAAFVLDERLSSQPIRILVEDGIVILQGTVQSFRRKLAAQQIAAQFDYVRELRNELRVEPSTVESDDDVAAAVRTSLAADADITRAAVTVAVNRGEVTLTGNVSSQWERALAEDLARSVRGVREVQNLLLIDDAQVVADEEMSAKIQTALNETYGLRDMHVRVAINDVAVVLSGKVDHWWQKETARQITERFRPMKIENEIVVRRQRRGEL